jgi:hypothetical protein
MVLYIMLGLGALIALGVAIYTFMECRKGTYPSSIGESLAFAALGATRAALVGSLVGAIIYLPISDSVTLVQEDHTRDLQAINMGDNLQGHFFLGSGYVNDEQIYSFYVKSDGGYYPDQVDADKVFIVEDSGTPRIVEHDFYTPDWLNPWHEKHERKTTYTIYVPPGSIKPIVNMDLPK